MALFYLNVGKRTIRLQRQVVWCIGFVRVLKTSACQTKGIYCWTIYAFSPETASAQPAACEELQYCETNERTSDWNLTNPAKWQVLSVISMRMLQKVKMKLRRSSSSLSLCGFPLFSIRPNDQLLCPPPSCPPVCQPSLSTPRLCIFCQSRNVEFVK